MYGELYALDKFIHHFRNAKYRFQCLPPYNFGQIDTNRVFKNMGIKMAVDIRWEAEYGTKTVYLRISRGVSHCEIRIPSSDFTHFRKDMIKPIAEMRMVEMLDRLMAEERKVAESKATEAEAKSYGPIVFCPHCKRAMNPTEKCGHCGWSEAEGDNEQ